MCTGAELMVGSMMLQGGNSLLSGFNQRRMADQQARQMQAFADAEAGAARVHAEQIRRAGRQQSGTAIAQMAAAGVDVNAATALDITSEIARGAEQDAWSTILTGQNRRQSGYVDAAGVRAGGRMAQTAGLINAGSSLLSAGSRINQPGWRT